MTEYVYLLEGTHTMRISPAELAAILHRSPAVRIERSLYCSVAQPGYAPDDASARSPRKINNKQTKIVDQLNYKT